MGRLSCAFLAQELGVDNKKRLLICFLLFMALGCASASLSFADVDSPPSDSPVLIRPEDSPSPEVSGELDQSFLLLPAYDLENSNSGKPIRAGDRLTFHLQGDLKQLPENLQIKMPSGVPGLDDLSTTLDIGDKVEGPDEHGERTLKITAVKAGAVTIPSIGLADQSGKMVARTNPLSIEVISSIQKDDPKPKEPEPALPPSGLGLPLATLVFLGLLALALVTGLIYGVVKWSQKRRPDEPEKARAPALPEDELAMKQLTELEGRGLIKNGQFKAFYFGISEIIKHYLGARYRFEAAESTTEEMLHHLERESGVQQASLDLLREMFEKLDRVKFTDHQPVAIEGTDLMNQAKKLVFATRKPPSVTA